MDAFTGAGPRQGSDDWKSCVAAKLGGGTSGKAAMDACTASGLAQGGEEWKKCVAGKLGAASPAGGATGTVTTTVPSKRAGTAPGPSNAQLQAAMDACTASGLKQGSDDWRKCVSTKVGGKG